MAPVNQIENCCQRARRSSPARDWQKARQVYLQALGLKSDAPDVHYGLATVYFQLKEFTSARPSLPGSDAPRSAPGRGLHQPGPLLNLLQQYDDEPWRPCAGGCSWTPPGSRGTTTWAWSTARKGELDLAITAYKEALWLNPRMADATSTWPTFISTRRCIGWR